MLQMQNSTTMQVPATLTRAMLKVPQINTQERCIYLKFPEKLHYKYDFDVYLPKYSRNLQRELCWTVKQQQALIWSIIQGNFIAPVYCCLNFDKTDAEGIDYYEVIDGKQRLTAIFDFMNNKFPVIVDGHDFYCKDFSYDLLLSLQWNLPKMICCIDQNFTDDDKIAWYLRLNYAGVPQQTEYLEDLSNLLKY